MLSMNWKTLIAAHIDNTAGNKNTSVFTKAWSPEQSQDQHFQTLTTDPDMVLFAADSNKKLLVLHSFKNAGGTLFRPEKKLMCLSGTGEIATVFEVVAANSSDPFHLITVVNAAATAFDEEHEEDEDYITSAEDHAGDFLLWSWAVGAGRVSATSCIFDNASELKGTKHA